MLSYPTVFYQLGMVGGVIATVGLGIMAYFSAWVMVDFKIRHMGVMNYPDIGDIIFGKWGRRIVAVGLTAKVRLNPRNKPCSQPFMKPNIQPITYTKTKRNSRLV